MKLLLCIDDTDNMESIGSGELLQIMGGELFDKGLGRQSYISRHQLFVHEDIPYTSHNSSMCCEVETKEENYENILSFTQSFLEENSAEGSDPGLCIIKKEELSQGAIDKLIDFGRLAKKTILKKEDAYSLAESMKNIIHLSEHGGTGQGVIGALAGCGLRLYGNDGRLKGKIYPENAGNIMSVEHICKRYPFQSIRLKNGRILNNDEKVRISDELKGVILDHQIVLIVKDEQGNQGNIDPVFEVCGKKELKEY